MPGFAGSACSWNHYEEPESGLQVLTRSVAAPLLKNSRIRMVASLETIQQLLQLACSAMFA